MITTLNGEPSGRRGSALILAIGLLVIFSALGTAYLSRMVVENQYSALEVREARARNLAVAGVNAVVGALQQSQGDQELRGVLGSHTWSFPTYEGIREADGLHLEVFPGRVAEAHVTVTDESGKVNLNHAPASVLQLVLGVDGATARGITGSLPRSGESPEEALADGRQWLLGVEDLLVRGLVTEEQYAAIDPNLVTTFSVADHAAPGRFLNVNTAPVPVLAAILDLSREKAQQVTVKRPFVSLKEMADAAEKPAFTFNVKPDATQPAVLPEPLSFSSRCFRIRSEGRYETGRASSPGTHAYVEAVILIDEDGAYDVVYWNTQAPAADDNVGAVETAEETAAQPAEA